jgi:hypothetical protein
MNPKESTMSGASLHMPSMNPEVYIGLDEQLRKGIAQQMRLLADLLDPPAAGVLGEGKAR